MSDDPNSQPPSADSAEDTAEKPSGSRIRLFVLIVVLCLMIAGLYYDRQVARPASRRAYDLTVELAEKNAQMSAEDQPVTAETVQAALKKRPRKLVETDDYAIETYRWRRGLLFLTYDVHVVYATDESGQLILQTAYLNDLPAEEDLPGYDYEIPEPPDESSQGE